MTIASRLGRVSLLGVLGALAACVASTNPPVATTAPPGDPIVAAPASTMPPEPAAPPPLVAPEPPPGPPEPPPVPPPVVIAPTPPPGMAGERRDDVSDRLFDRSSNWDKLGERRVDGKRDRDVIKIGKKQRFLALAVVVEHSALEMFDLTITFGDGTTFSPTTRFVFGEDTRSRVVDLPGDARTIKKVEFRYGNLPGGGKSQVELWGFDARRDAGDGRDGMKPPKPPKPKRGDGSGSGAGTGGGGRGGGGGGNGGNR